MQPKLQSFIVTALLTFSILTWTSLGSASSKDCSLIFESEKAHAADSSFSSPSLDLLGEKLDAVHATDAILPGGRIGPYYQLPPNNPKDARIRATVHFALGGLVPKHGENSWENKKLAVVFPFKHLFSQLRNVFTYDTSVVGAVQIPTGAVVLAPYGTILDLPAGITIRYYNSAAETLREAVDKLLIERKSWRVRMEAGFGKASTPVEVNGTMVNQRSLFSNLLKADPTLSYGPIWNDRLKELDFLINRLYFNMTPTPTTSNIKALKIIEKASFRHLRALKNDANLRKLIAQSNEARSALQANLKIVHQYLRLVALEIQMQSKFRKSMFGSDQAIYKLLLDRYFSDPVRMQPEQVIRDFPGLADADLDRPLNIIQLLDLPWFSLYDISGWTADMHDPELGLASRELHILELFIAKHILEARPAPVSSDYAGWLALYVKASKKSKIPKTVVFEHIRANMIRLLREDRGEAKTIASLMNLPVLAKYFGSEGKDIGYQPPYSAEKLASQLQR